MYIIIIYEQSDNFSTFDNYPRMKVKFSCHKLLNSFRHYRDRYAEQIVYLDGLMPVFNTCHVYRYSFYICAH